MTICIAKSRSSLGHYFMRTVPAEEVQPAASEDIPALINSLTTVKTHKQLASAIEHLPLLLGTRGGSKQPKRVMAPRECLELLDSEFEPVDKKILAYEAFLYAPRELKANSSKESPAADLDAYRLGFADELRGLGEEFKVIVEPVQDWMTFRNILAMGAALLANIENPPKEGRVLEAAGFFEPGKSSFKFPVFVAPLKFQAGIYLLQFFKHPLASSTSDVENADYLYSLYGSVIDGIDEDVFISTHWDATQKRFTPADIAGAPFAEDRYLYLVVRQSGSQLDMAKRILNVLWQATQSLVDDDGSPLGMTLDAESLFLPRQVTPTYRFPTLVSRAWYALCYHENRKLIACKHCGCGVLASLRGPAKEYCSDSCRTQDRG